MNLTMLLQLPFHSNGAWHELQRRQLSIPLLAWALVLPLSLLPPVLLYFAGSHCARAPLAVFAGFTGAVFGIQCGGCIYRNGIIVHTDLPRAEGTE